MILRFFIIVLLVFTNISYAGIIAKESPAKSKELEKKKHDCSATGGYWIRFDFSCADLCSKRYDPLSTPCYKTTIESCDCGFNKCYDGIQCQYNS